MALLSAFSFFLCWAAGKVARQSVPEDWLNDAPSLDREDLDPNWRCFLVSKSWSPEKVSEEKQQKLNVTGEDNSVTIYTKRRRLKKKNDNAVTYAKLTRARPSWPTSQSLSGCRLSRLGLLFSESSRSTTVLVG